VNLSPCQHDEQVKVCDCDFELAIGELMNGHLFLAEKRVIFVENCPIYVQIVEKGSVDHGRKGQSHDL